MSGDGRLSVWEIFFIVCASGFLFAAVQYLTFLPFRWDGKLLMDLLEIWYCVSGIYVVVFLMAELICRRRARSLFSP